PRWFRTVLGVGIGLTTLIAVASIMVGVDQDMRGFLTDFGPETLFVFKFTPGIHIGRLSQEERSRKPLSLEDVTAIKEQCPAVEDVTAELFPRIQSAGPPQLFTARYQNHEINNVDFTGALPSYENVYNIKVERGRYFSQARSEERRRKPLALEDVTAIKEQCPAVEDVTAELFPRIQSAGPPQLFTARYQNHEINNVDFTGALPSYENVYNIKVERGRYFSQA